MSAIGIDVSVGGAHAVHVIDDAPHLLEARDLRHVWQLAQRDWAGVEGAVITASAGGHAGERRGLLRQARQADIEVLRILSAPAAAAFGHWQASQQPGTYAVLDLRRSTFDCCVVSVDATRIEVLSAIGFADLGADAVDGALCDALAGDAPLDARDRTALRRHARAARDALSDAFIARIDIRLPSGAALRRQLTRHQMGAYAERVRGRWMAACQRAIAEADTCVEWLDGVLVLGFAPMLGKVARRCFHRPPVRLGADGAALGAARYGAVLLGDAPGPIVLERSTHGLALQDRDGQHRLLLAAGTPLPASVACTPARGERLIHLDWRNTIVGTEQLEAGTARLVLNADGVVQAHQAM